MQSENELFVELTSEEASTITGGNARAVFADVQQIIAGSASRWGKTDQIASVVLQKYRNWSWNGGGGVVLGDVKGGRSGDFRRIGWNSGKPDDLPNGWDWAVVRNGKALFGGFGGPKW
jgi:hypothetical protein